MSTERTLRSPEETPLEFWLGLYLVLLSGQYLTNLLHVTDFPSWQGRVFSMLLALTGVGLFAAGGYVLNRGLEARQTRRTLGVTAVLFAAADLAPSVIYGNPLARAVGVPGTLVVTADLLGSLVLAAAAVWLVAAAFDRPPAEGAFRLRGLVFLGAAALQEGVVPLFKVVVNVIADPGALAAVAGASLLTLAAFILPPLTRGLAGLLALWVLWPAVGPSVTARLAGRSPQGARRLLPRQAALAVALWALADALVLGSLWVSWSDGLGVPPPLAARLQTSLLLALPVLPLSALASALRRQALRQASGP